MEDNIMKKNDSEENKDSNGKEKDEEETIGSKIYNLLVKNR